MAYTPESWDKIIRQILLRANILQADTAATLAANYVVDGIGTTQISDRGTEFPIRAIEDALLNAADRLVDLISLDRKSIYRSYFHDTLTNITNGTLLSAYTPVTNTNSKRVGVIGKVYADGDTTLIYTFRPYLDVINRLKMESMRQPVYWYYTDNTRIWLTEDDGSVGADIVVWDKTAQRALMATAPRGACPFPEALHEALVCGALSYIFRSSFNSDQMTAWRNYFENTIQMLSGDMSTQEVKSRIID